MRHFFIVYFWLVAITFFLFIPSSTNAASLYIDPAINTLNRGDSITLSVRLDTDEEIGECINAVDAVITYTDNIEPVDISLGDSIFTVWVEQPTINRENRTITFAGGIPNGYCGRVAGDPRLTNVLTKIIFRSPGFSIGGSDSEEVEAEIAFAPETTAYLNDGLGTKANLKTYWSTVKLNSKPGSTFINSWQDEISADDIPPEEFSIQLVKGDKNYSNKYYIIAETTDKQTGIDHYEIMEEPMTQFTSFQWGRADAPWKLIQQPPVYVLEDQSLNSIIRVKAIDKAGNEYIANLIPDESARTISRGQLATVILVGAILIIVLLIAIVSRIYLKRRKKSRLEAVEADENNMNYENEK
jgi:hypothetical protein